MKRFLPLLATYILLIHQPFLFAQAPVISFIVDTTDGPLPAAPVVKWNVDWSLRLGAPVTRRVEDAELVGLRRIGQLPRPWPENNVLLLTNGDRLPFTPDALHLDEERLAWTPDRILRAEEKELEMLQAFVAVVWFTAPARSDDIWQVQESLRLRPGKTDLVLYRNGDRLEGSVRRIDPKQGCSVLADGKMVDIPIAQLAAVAFNDELQARPKTKGIHGHATLGNGARLTFTTLMLDAEHTRLTGKLLAGPKVSFSLEDLIAMHLRQDRAVYLADMPVASYVSKPYLSLDWPLGRDRSVRGGPLRLAGGWYDKGLGMHASSQVAYKLNGRFAWFESWAGLDDGAGPRSRARLSVLVDGKELDLKAPAERTRKDRPLELRLDVRGAKELTLRVEHGGFGDVQALVTWANARLVKEGP